MTHLLFSSSLYIVLESPQLVSVYCTLSCNTSCGALSLEQLARLCPNAGRLEGAIAEAGDLLYYCNDIINSGVPALRSIMTKHIMHMLVLPVLIPSLRPVGKCATPQSV